MGGFALTAGGACGPVRADEIPTSDASLDTSSPGQISEIVVTAERRAERLQDVPAAVTALSGDNLEARGIDTISDLTAMAPNLNFLTSNAQVASRQAYVFIRGIGQDQTFINNDPGVGLYVDGVYIGRSQGALFDVLDLERIEVLRGPQGTLYGRNTIGGAINVITQAPSADDYAKVNLAYGNYNQVIAQAIVNGALTSNLFGSIALERTSHDGYDKELVDPTCPNCSRQAMSNDDTWGGRAAVRAVLGEATTVDWNGDFTVRHDLPQGLRLSFWSSNPPAPFSFFAFPLTLVHGRPPAAYENTTPNTTEMSYSGYDHQRSYGTSLTVAVKTGWGTLKSITSWRGLQIDDSNDGTGSPLAIFTNATDAIRQTQESQEFQLVSAPFGGRLELVSGLFGYLEEASEDQALAQLFADLQPCFNATQPPFWSCPAQDVDHYRYRVANLAAYENATYHVTSKLTFGVGLRYSYERKRLAFTDDVNPQLDLDQVKGFASWTPRVSLSYQLTPDLLVYSSYSQGYKSGNFNSGNFGPPYVKPETVDAYELGLKTEWLERRLLVNLAGFYSKYSNMQLQISGAPPLHAFANAARSKIYGYELETQLNASDYLHFDANAGYTHTRITQVDPSALDVTQGARLPFVPDWTVNAGADLILPVSSAGKLDFRLEYQYVGTETGDANDTPDLITPAHGIFNLRGTLFSGGTRDWQLYAYVNNLANKRYQVASASVLPVLFAVAVDGDPRTYRVGIRYKFR
jgi:iron complex outermembrane receptor protein